jgi:hypothetical protein
MKKAITILLASLMLIFAASCGKSSEEDTSGRTIIPIQSDVDSIIDTVDAEIKETNLGYSTKYWNCYGSYDESDNAYFVFIKSACSDTDLNIYYLYTEIECHNFCWGAYNKVVDYFDDTGVGVISVMCDKDGTAVCAYNGEDDVYLNGYTPRDSGT